MRKPERDFLPPRLIETKIFYMATRDFHCSASGFVRYDVSAPTRECGRGALAPVERAGPLACQPHAVGMGCVRRRFMAEIPRTPVIAHVFLASARFSRVPGPVWSDHGVHKTLLKEQDAVIVRTAGLRAHSSNGLMST